MGDVQEAVGRSLGVLVRPHDEALIGEPARLEVIQPGGERLHAHDVDLRVRLRRERIAGVASDRRVALQAVADDSRTSTGDRSTARRRREVIGSPHCSDAARRWLHANAMATRLMYSRTISSVRCASYF